MKVWLLIVIFNPMNSGANSIVIDYMPTAEECERVAIVVKEINPIGNAAKHRCVERWVVK